MALQGRHLTVAAGVWVPWCIIDKEPDGSVSATGVAVDFFKMIAAQLNFTYTLVLSPDNEWGRGMPNGTWTGLLGMCKRNEVDMAIGPFGVTWERAQAVDFSQELYVDHFGVFLPRPKLDQDLWGLIKPLAWQVWTVLGFAVILSIFLGLILNTVMNKAQRKSSEIRPIPSFRMMWIIRIILKEPVEILPETNTGRIFLGTWLIVSLILSTGYGGMLTSLLAVPFVTVPVDSLEDLISYRKIPWANEQGTSMHQLFSDAKEGLYKEALEGGTLVYSSFDERHRIKEEGMAVICDVFSMKKIMNDDYAETGECNYYIAKQYIKSAPISYAFPKGSFLIHHFDKWLGPLKEAGLVWRSVQELTANATACMVAPGKEGDTTISPFSFMDLAGTFLVSGIGLLIGVISFLAEILYHRSRESI